MSLFDKKPTGSATAVFTEQILTAVAQLEIRARRRVTALLAGNYRSAFRGSGMQFKEFRHYEPGDDIRHMSWSVTARTKRATVKTYEEERELDVILVIDTSGSSLFGLSSKRKVEMYAELVALLGLAALKSGDRVGSLFFNETPGPFLPPRKKHEQAMSIVSSLLKEPLIGKRSDLGAAMTYLTRVLKQRTLIIVLSDFLLPPFADDLCVLSKRHEIVLLHCYDDAERGIGEKGLFEVWDPETGKTSVLDLKSKQVRKALAEHHTRLRNDLSDLSAKLGTDYLTLSVEDDYIQRLVHFFRRRGPARL